MGIFNRFFKKPIFQNYNFLALIWLGTAFVGGLLKYLNGTYNNYSIFQGAFWHTLNQLPLYCPYPQEYDDVNLYGIVFSALIAPFAMLPDWAGLVLWVVCSSLGLYVALKMLSLERWQFSVVIWYCVNELFTGVARQQFNIGIAAIIIFAFVAIERKREFWAACAIMLGLMTKVYGVVGLAFLPFSKNRVRLFGWLVLWGAILFFLPMLYSGYDFVVGQYQDWFAALSGKNDINMFAMHQNISLLGLVRKISGDPTYSDLWLIGGGLILFALPYLRFKQYSHTNFRLMILSSVLLFTVLFSTGSESSGYIIAMVGVGVWFVTTSTKTKALNLTLLLFAFVLTSLSPTDIIPPYIRRTFVLPYALKALPCVLIWFKVCYELMFVDFGITSKRKELVYRRYDLIDIVLPCYNPQEGWVKILVDTHARFTQVLGGRKLRFIVVNDGSSRGYDDELVAELQQALPNTIVVDNKINQGKGASIRAGVAKSDSECILYTDIDFPYEIESMCQVVERLEMGNDIVIATRNATYYRELSLFRKMVSKASKTLNMIILGLGHNDTQGGLKGINRVGRECLLRTRIKRFLFDTEFIYLASKDNEVNINEIPTDLREGVLLPNMRPSVIVNELGNFMRISIRK